MIGAVQRLADRITGRRVDQDGPARMVREHRLGVETTTTRRRRGHPAPRRGGGAGRRAEWAAQAYQKCDRCGTAGPLKNSRGGMVCVGGCNPPPAAA